MIHAPGPKTQPEMAADSPAVKENTIAEVDGLEFTFQNTALAQDVFFELAESSGWQRMTQNALAEEKRLPYVLQPKPLVLVARDENGKIIAARGGINFGAYAYSQFAMVSSEYQGKGLGTQLLKAFQAELNRLNGGETSIAIFAHPESQQYYLNRGFIPLKNALVLKRGTVIQDCRTSDLLVETNPV